MADIAGVREEISIAGENKGKERPKNIIVRGAKGKERPKNIIVRGAWVHNLKNIDVIIYEGYRQGNRKSVRGTSVVEFLFPAGYTVKRNPAQRGLIYAAA